jgi:hypothetical protein
MMTREIDVTLATMNDGLIIIQTTRIHYEEQALTRCRWWTQAQSTEDGCDDDDDAMKMDVTWLH